MDRMMPLGRRLHHMGPPVAENTTEFRAGPLTIGVEPRVLDNPLPKEWGKADGAMFTDGGVAIHVFDSDTGFEYLRFDCFRESPHYHYNEGDEGIVVVPFDVYAQDADMLDWTLERLRTRLPVMLANTAGAHMADQLDDEALLAAVDEVEAFVRA